MTFISVRCPHCHSEQVVKRGKTHRGTQRYLCQNTACNKGSFLLDYRNRGCVPEVRQTIIRSRPSRLLRVCPAPMLTPTARCIFRSTRGLPLPATTHET